MRITARLILIFLLLNLLSLIIFASGIFYAAFFIKTSFENLLSFGIILILVSIIVNTLFFYSYIRNKIIKPFNKIAEIAGNLSTGDFSERFSQLPQKTYFPFLITLDNMVDHFERLLDYIDSSVKDVNFLSNNVIQRLEIIEKREDDEKKVEIIKEIKSSTKRITRISLQLTSLIRQFKLKDKINEGF
mgnify:CR=1 FL=1